MAIDFSKTASGDDPLLAQINTTPLVDVMLVLLIIFLITIPAVNSTVAVQLPQQVLAVRHEQPEAVIITVDATGASYWFDTRISKPEEMDKLLARAAALNPQPEVHIRGDGRAQYAAIGRIVNACQKLGIARVGFLTAPPALY